MLSKDIKSLFKHSGIYGVGKIASQAVGFLLLPLYTRYLTPVDYGVASIIDITMALVGITVAAGVLNAMSRFYHEYDDEGSKNRVISTMYWTVVGISAISAVAVFACSSFLSRELFTDSRYAVLFDIAAAGLVLGFILDTAMLYLMIESRSVLYVAISLCNLMLMVGMNIWFIVFMGLGLKGVFYSTLITRAILSIAVSFPILLKVGVGFSGKLAASMLRYSFPLIFSNLFRLGVNESDKYFINYFFSPLETGIYTIAEKIGNSVHMLITSPFMQSYNPKRFEIMKRTNAPEIYAQILSYYLLLIVTAGLALAAYSNEIMRLMTTEKFFQAGAYIPLVVTSWILFGMRYHFETGLLIKKNTRYFAYINGGTSFLAISLNYLLIGEYKIWGALVALNVSQLVTTGLFYLVSQRLYPVHYQFSFMLKLAALGLCCYAATSFVENDNMILSIALKSGILALYLLSLRLFGLIDAPLLSQLRQAGGRIAALAFPGAQRQGSDKT